jgi:hypothetical protein
VLGLGGGVAQQRGIAVDVEPHGRTTDAERRTRPFVPSGSAVATQLRPLRDS